ncbi:MAG: 3-deoxy-manno-octulosonate cytidylyltransferase [Methylococcales bacterium]|nr:3-deoxy-manno-octulosonate cytidylyltransferase [Methylococcales bacterium]MBT7408099.1 3-deoxy-manno-octulosonate cytidylyltransferase [Methylococcales bacterium]
MPFKVVIPSRFDSSRLPGKPLLPIAGKPMIQHVVERAQQCGASETIVATDDQRIFDVVQNLGYQVLMTSAEHTSGTDRLAEVVKKMNWEDDSIVINLQGDEPLIPVVLLSQVANDLSQHTKARVATLQTRITEASDLFDPNVVKLVTDADGYALYFSRAPIPWHRQEFSTLENPTLPNDLKYFRHIGIYGYRASFLKQYVNWKPSTIETTESLEQLRVLHYGDKIHVSEASEMPGHGVDTQEDLERVEKIMITSGTLNSETE